MADFAWGNAATEFFYQLTPDVIFDAVERSTGQICTGRIQALNSFENRVYEIEIELPEQSKNPSDHFLIAKFYRPGRWSKEQIAEEHEFLLDLVTNEIPVIAPMKFLDGETIHILPNEKILYTVFPKCGGRSPDELDDEQLGRVGRLLARMHGVGAIKKARSRITINPETYGINNLNYILSEKLIPPDLEKSYTDTAKEICEISQPWFDAAEIQRIHGDCHFGNLLFGRDGFFWVDFDDCVVGPPVQDIWLMIPGRDDYGRQKLEILLEAYESMKEFDRRTLRLIEPLRALRFIHFSAWIAKRWKDPAFPKAFASFGEQRYWYEQLRDLQTQLQLIKEQSVSAQNY
jgi:Ser/Thr protein kinase RdoA (MazF antagonist)